MPPALTLTTTAAPLVAAAPAPWPSPGWSGARSAALALLLAALSLLLGACVASKAPSSESSSTDSAALADSGGAEGGAEGGSGPRACSPPDPAPAPTREGHPSDGWRWQKAGPLFEDEGTLAFGDGDLAPTLADTGAGLRLLFTRQRGPEQTLWSSFSDDGLRWSAPVPVTGLGPAGYPSLLAEGDALRLWYGSGGVEAARSDDGVAFTPGGSALRPGAAGGFDTVSLLYPRVAPEDGGALALYYTGFNGQRFAIGRAESSDGGATFVDAALHLERDPSGFDNAAVAMPSPGRAPDDGAPLLWYGGYDTAETDPGPWRVGLLRGGERRVALPLGASGLDAFATRDPAPLPFGDGWLMVYVGMGDDGVYRLLRATSDVCSG